MFIHWQLVSFVKEFILSLYIHVCAREKQSSIGLNYATIEYSVRKLWLIGSQRNEVTNGYQKV